VGLNAAPAPVADEVVLRAAGLEKRHAGGRVLRLPPLAVRAREVVAIVGPSGSGKTTLLNLLAGIDVADAGAVAWHAGGGSHDLGRLGERARTLFRRRHLGIVFQFYNLLPTLTVAENVLLPLRLNGIVGADAVALGRLATLGLGDRLGAYPDALSGGEQQRVAIARALAHAPAAVLADEPTGNLDAAAAEAVTELLVSAARAAGSVLVVATHAARVAAAADRVLDLAAVS
jgi:putative ABC transport system ATP-binding protein